MKIYMTASSDNCYRGIPHWLPCGYTPMGEDFCACGCDAYGWWCGKDLAIALTILFWGG